MRDYDALEVTLDRRLSGRWAARAAYTWSRLSGNYSGLALSDEDGRVAPNVGGVFDAPIGSFDERGQPVYGVLATDRPHQVKVQGLYIWPFGTSVGGRVVRRERHPAHARGGVHAGHPGHVPGDGRATGGCPSSHGSISTSGTTCASGPGFVSGSART